MKKKKDIEKSDNQFGNLVVTRPDGKSQVDDDNVIRWVDQTIVCYFQDAGSYSYRQVRSDSLSYLIFIETFSSACQT